MKPRDLSASMIYAYNDAKISGMYFAWAKEWLRKAREARDDGDAWSVSSRVRAARECWHSYLKYRGRFCANAITPQRQQNDERLSMFHIPQAG